MNNKNLFFLFADPDANAGQHANGPVFSGRTTAALDELTEI
jgi:hypothetical protein